MSRTPEQILEIVDRGASHSLRYAFLPIDFEIENAPESSSLLFEFIPVKIVAIIENCVRNAVRELVDFGAPYKERGISLISKRNQKSLAQALRLFSDRRLTIGQLAAHSFAVSSLADVLSVLGELLQSNNIADSLADQTTRWIEDKDIAKKCLIADKTENFEVVDILFQTRHIIVHEMGNPVLISKSDASKFSANAGQFVEAIEWMVIQALHDYCPRTQSMMNMESGAKAFELSAELDALRGGSARDFEGQADPIAELEYHWDRFSDLTAKRYAGLLEEGWPGTIAPTLHASMLQTLLRWRIENYASQRRWDPQG